MDVIEKSLLALNQFLIETSPDVIEKYIQEVIDLQIPGPSLYEYFNDEYIIRKTYEFE